MASLSKVYFTAKGEADSGGRTGTVRTRPDDGGNHGNILLKMAKHPNLGGKGGGTSPEELLALGYAACFKNLDSHIYAVVENSELMGRAYEKEEAYKAEQRTRRCACDARDATRGCCVLPARGVSSECAMRAR